MTVILRHRVPIGGWTGGPGLMTTYWRPGTGGGSNADANDVSARVRAWLQAIRSTFSVAWFANPEGVCEAIEDTTGALVNVFGTVTPAQVTGSGVGNLAPVSTQILIRANTGLVVRRRFLEGRINLGPVVVAAFDGSGNVTAATQLAIQTPTTALLSGGATLSFPVVWQRPHTASTRDPRPSYAGTSIAVSSFQVLTKPAVLRSRRD